MKLQFTLMSMTDLERIVKTKAENKTTRELAARELAKRENNYYHKSHITRAITLFDYGI